MRLYCWDKDAQFLEYAGGKELITLVEQGRDEQAMRIIASVIEPHLTGLS